MRIVVGVDGSDASITALELVASTTWPIGTQVRLVGAYELATNWTGLTPLPAETAADEDAERAFFDRIHALAEPLQRRGCATETVVARGRPADVLLNEADDLQADLVVVGSRGLGVAASALLGSVSAALVDHASCPVLVARTPAVTRILVATDGSRSAEAIPAVLQAWRIFRDAPIDVLSVAPAVTDRVGGAPVSGLPVVDQRLQGAAHEVDRHRVMADEMAARLVAGGWHATGALRYGDAPRQIEAAAAEWGADLIITGSRGLSGLRRLLIGSVAHHVLLHSRCSVLVMRGHVPARELHEGWLSSAPAALG
jgi:nucleotide-binding universal stress UspA family protein